MSIKHTTTVDIGDLRKLSKPIHLMQYDKSLPEIEVHITKDGQEYTIPSGYSATIRWGKPDKHGCTATGTVSGSTVTFQVTEQMACVAGRNKVTVEIVESDSSQAGTAKFEVIVDSNPIGDNTIVSDSEIADIQKAIEAGQNADKALETAKQTQSIIDDVTEKAESASTLINNATESLESSVETARGYAETASTSASNASASAKSASDTVSGFDTHVAEKETELDTYTSEKKTELDTYTNTEKKVIDEYLDQVGADIMSAKDTAVTASETATEKANEARASAQTAAEKAKEAKASADSIANITSDVDKLKEEIADNATLENGVIKFWKTSTEENRTDTLLYSVDISSIGGTGGLDLENLTLSVSQVGNYQRLSMSDGTTTKNVDIPIITITDEQVQTAVTEYLDANPVQTGATQEEAEQIQKNTNDIANLKNNKVDKVEGKGLSTNDFTNEEKDKLSSLSNYDDSQIKGELGELISGLTQRLNALADSDDETLDQMSEIVSYIKNNKNLIDDITTSKVNVSDIINNLTTNLSNKVLSASMGVELKKLIDAIKVPGNLSELAGDTTHRTVTDAEKTAWNNKSTFSGNYNDLTNKPSLFSGNYNDLSGKPTLITEERVNELINAKLPKSAEEVQY